MEISSSVIFHLSEEEESALEWQVEFQLIGR